jgi:RNA-directed DNA polymerase
MGKHSSLATVVGGKSVLAVSFFKYHKQSEYFLRLDGGSDKLRNFIAKYTEDLEYFEHSPLKHPVVILIDNDKGAPAIFSLMDSKFRSKVSWTTTAPFYPICSNLILVKTPESASDGVS